MMIKIANICLAVLFALLIWWQVQVHLLYQLCQLEHTNLFLGDWDNFLVSLNGMGEFVKWLGTWGIQFFDKSFWGILMFILPVWGLFAMIGCILRRKCQSGGIWISLAACVAVLQLFSLYDYNFYWSGAVALCLAVGVLWILSFCKPFKIRIILFVIGIPLVFWLLGSVALVYVLGGMALFYNKKEFYLVTVLPLVVYLLIISLFYYTGRCSSLLVIISPAMYYEPLLDIPHYHIFTWFVVVLLLGIGHFLSMNIEKKKIVAWIVCLFGWLLPSGLLIQYGSMFRNQTNIDLWRLNHYAYTENWDGILEFLHGKPMNNYLFMNYANMALAYQGKLGTNAFNYSPRGVNALLVKANSTGTIRMLASDIHYMVGCIAEAQQHAFEAQTTFPTSLGIQTLKRLVKTNLIFGHYAVAEKYLNIIGMTTFHKDWAKLYKSLLYNDKAVEADVELGKQRRNLSKKNRFAMFEGWKTELEDILFSNPTNDKTMIYLGLSYLLNKDMEGFHRFLNKYYGTEVMSELPLVFQQAVIVLFQQEKDKWEKYKLSPQVVNLFSQYRDLFLKNQHHPNLGNTMARSFGNTFWYYFMFV